MTRQLLGTLNRIVVYPIKSLDGVTIERCLLTPGGALRNDRRLALFDGDGRILNAKRSPRLQQIETRYDLERDQVTLSDRSGAGTGTFSLQHEQGEIARWLSGFLNQPVTLQEDRQLGFPDDPAANGPTVISIQSLEEVGRWFGGLEPAETRRRFRANLELDLAEPFAEDCLFSASGEPVRFSIGPLQLLGINPCARCAVPSRDSRSGEADAGFQKTFARQRQVTLPVYAPVERFDHFYRLAVNTRLAEPLSDGRELVTGTEVWIGVIAPGDQAG